MRLYRAFISLWRGGIFAKRTVEEFFEGGGEIKELEKMAKKRLKAEDREHRN